MKFQWLQNLILIDDNLSKQLPDIFSNNKDIFETAEYLKKFSQLWKDIIFEYPSIDANYGNDILSYIDNNKNKIIVNKNQLLKFIPIKWKYYTEIKTRKDFDIYIFKFDFKNSETSDFSLITELSNFYNIEVNDKNKLLHKIAFANLTVNSLGCVRPLIKDNTKDIILLFLNTNNICHYQLRTINHELFHTFQELLEINIFNESESIISTLSKSELLYLNNKLIFSSDKIKYYFSIHEFWNYIHNNLIDYLEDLYNINYKDKLNKNEFIEYILDLASKQILFDNNDLGKFLLTIFYLKNKLKDIFYKVIDILKIHFN